MRHAVAAISTSWLYFVCVSWGASVQGDIDAPREEFDPGRRSARPRVASSLRNTRVCFMNELATPGVWELGADGTIVLQALAGALIGLLTGGVALFLAYYLRARKRPSGGRGAIRALDDRLAHLRKLAEELARVSAEVQAVSATQIRVARKAAAEAEKNTKLASVSKEAAKEVADLFEAQGRLSIKVTIWIGVVSLVVSNVVSVIVTLALAG